MMSDCTCLTNQEEIAVVAVDLHHAFRGLNTLFEDLKGVDAELAGHISTLENWINSKLTGEDSAKLSGKSRSICRVAKIVWERRRPSKSLETANHAIWQLAMIMFMKNTNFQIGPKDQEMHVNSPPKKKFWQQPGNFSNRHFIFMMIVLYFFQYSFQVKNEEIPYSRFQMPHS